MLEGMYSAAAGMAAQQERLSALSNDLANVNTTGYKTVRLAFRDLLYTPSGPGSVPSVESGAGSATAQVGRTTEQGNLQQTGRSLDVALVGQGFLEVRDRRGRVALTRDGSLERRPDGQLATSTGELVGVRVPTNVAEDAIGIGADGGVTVAGRLVGRLRLVTVTAPERLLEQGANLFSPAAASGAPTAARTGVRLQQGALEASNVDLADTMTSLIDAQRAYELSSKAITTQDQMLEIANQVKR